jgi:hypothetical protein
VRPAFRPLLKLQGIDVISGSATLMASFLAQGLFQTSSAEVSTPRAASGGIPHCTIYSRLL